LEVAVEPSSEPVPLIRPGTVDGGGRRRTVVVVVLSAMATIVFISLALIWSAGRPQRGSPLPQAGDQPLDASSPGRPSPAGPASGKPVSQAPAATPAAEPAVPATKPEPAPPQSSPSAPASSAATTVMLRTAPPGASVILDESQQLTCTSPCSLPIPPGRHTVSTTMEGYRPGLRIFRFPEEPDLMIYLARMTGQVQVVSDPPGASILVDDRRRTETTPTTLELPAGKHVIAVVREGYARNEQEIEVKDTAFMRMNFTLGK
jgi:hypothetical protein